MKSIDKNVFDQIFRLRKYTTYYGLLQHLPRRSKKYIWFLLLGMIILSGLETLAAGAMAFYASAIADPENILHSSYITRLNGILKSLALTNIQEMLIALSIIVVCLIIVNNLARALVAYFNGLFGATMACHINEKLFAGFLYTPYEWHLSQHSEDLALSISWRFYFINFINAGLNLVSNCLVALVLLGSVFFVAPLISLYVFLIVGCCSVFIFGRFGRYIDKTVGQLIKYRKSLNKQAHKILQGIKETKVNNLEGLFLENFHNQAHKESKLNALQQVLPQLSFWVIEILGIGMLSLSVCTLYIVLESSKVRTTGVIALLAVTAWRVLPAAKKIVSNLSAIRASAPFVKNNLNYLNELNASIPKRTDGNRISHGVRFEEGLTLEAVSFSYEGSNDCALANVNIRIEKGDTIGIVGGSGAGKSTLIDIIIGLLFPSTGSVLIDGEPLTAETVASWVQRIGYVAQFPYLCDGTLAENVAFGLTGDAIDREHVLSCCNMAALQEFQLSLPNGIDTLIGDRGVKLSGGQRQRVAIARALYNNPEILVFDEATSSLDTKNEKSIQTTIFNFKGRQTLIIVAHRLSTVEDCDTIVWWENGKIKKKGPPVEILKQYRSMM